MKIKCWTLEFYLNSEPLPIYLTFHMMNLLLWAQLCKNMYTLYVPDCALKTLQACFFSSSAAIYPPLQLLLFESTGQSHALQAVSKSQELPASIAAMHDSQSAALMGKLFGHLHFSVMPATRWRQVSVFWKACFAENALLQGKACGRGPWATVYQFHFKSCHNFLFQDSYADR